MIPKNFMDVRQENYSCSYSLRGRQKWTYAQKNINIRLSIYVSFLFPHPYQCSEFITLDFKMISSDLKNDRMCTSGPPDKILKGQDGL